MTEGLSHDREGNRYQSFRACYDRMDAAEALLEQAEADEAGLSAEIEIEARCWDVDRATTLWNP